MNDRLTYDEGSCSFWASGAKKDRRHRELSAIVVAFVFTLILCGDTFRRIVINQILRRQTGMMRSSRSPAGVRLFLQVVALLVALLPQSVHSQRAAASLGTKIKKFRSSDGDKTKTSAVNGAQDDDGYIFQGKSTK